ncbi:hypothetical protein [Roseinatronobacter sp.]
MSLYADIAYGRDTELSQQELNRRAKIIADAIEALREFVPEWEKQVDLLSTVGLNRINEALLPAYQQIIDIADLGALLTTKSTTPVTIGVGTKTFLVPEAVRLNFAPTNFLMAVANGDFDQHLIGRLSSYDNETGVLVIQVERVSGEGEFANWQISPVATTDDLEALRDQVAANAQIALEKAEEAVLARNQAVPAGQAAVTALGTFQASWYGPRETEPEGAALGAQFLDTSQSPNVVKVLTHDGWAPTVTVSVGGSRQQVYVATEGQTGPFTVDGGFSFGSVNVNGAEFFNGHGVTFNLEEGEFTFDAPLSAGDLVAFRGHLANDLIDIYTKDEVYSKAETDAIVAPFTGRNVIINGNFDIWQRGTSFSGAGYGADRWVNLVGGSSATQSRQSFVLGQTDVPNEPVYFCRTVVSSVTGAGSFACLAQFVESVRTFAGQTVTVSFWVKADASKKIVVEFVQNFGSGGSPSTVVDAIGTTEVSIGTSWQKVTVTANIPSIGGKSLGTNNNDRLDLIIWFDAGSNFDARTDSLGHQSGTFDIAQVQLEAGPIATPFERRDRGFEELLCQRYYQTAFAGYRLDAVLGNSTIGGGGTWSFNTKMRRVPDVTVLTVNTTRVTNLTFVAVHTDAARAEWTWTSGTIATPRGVNATIGLDAEL